MSKLVKDYLNENTLTLMLDYYSGQKQVRLAKSRGRKTCSIMLPFVIELIEASGCVPISCYRLGRFLADRELRLMRLSKNIFGTSSLVRSLSFINRAIGPDWLKNLADKGILGGLWKVYHESVNTAKEQDFPLDACFGTRVYYGALTQFQKDIDFEIGYGTRCGWLTKFYQACGKIKPLVFIDIPMKFDENAFNYQKNEILRVIGEIEKITNKSFSENALKEEIRLHNSIAKSYSEILKVWAQDITAMGPLGFTYVLSMLHFGYTDRLTKGSKYFDRLLRNLLQEFKKNLKTDLTGTPKLILAPMFGGFDPETLKIVSELGGRLLFADWTVLKILDPIKESGDPIENYTDYLLNISRNWYDNSTVINNWIEVIEDLKLDGVIFNSVYGCKSLTPAFRLFKDRLIELDVPIIDISFHNMEENIGQNRTRIGAFIEMIKG